MVVFDCWVCEREDGTIEVAPFPQSAHVEAKRRIQDAKVEATSAENAS